MAFSVNRIDHVVLNTGDVDRAKRATALQVGPHNGAQLVGG